jgi:hypothetical protein
MDVRRILIFENRKGKNMNCRLMTRFRSILPLFASVLALAVLVPLAANAQVTVFHARVTVGSALFPPIAVYCDTGTACANQIWTLPALGITVNGGQTLVLTQTGRITNGTVSGGNFDTSDRFTSTTLADCSPTSPCLVTVELDTGSGLTTVYSNNAPNPINNLNAGPPRVNEASPYSLVFSASNYTLSLGYADNSHGCAVNCFPNPFNGTLGTSAATYFVGAGLSGFSGQACNPSNCFDAGVLLITGITVPQGPLRTVTQGGWGAPPHGGNPGALLVNNFTKVYPAGVRIGCSTGQSLLFTSAAQIQAFLPQGGVPGTLPNAGVFAGQVLALQLNVDFSKAGVLPTGLATTVISGPPLSGFTVQQVLNLANSVLGGCTTLPAFGVTSISQLNDIVSSINEKYDQ